MFWNNLKISIAGAKLSHLVQRDKIWDHGSMVEQVKTVFLQVQKAMLRNTDVTLQKYMTHSGYQKLKVEMEKCQRFMGRSPATDLLTVDIVGVYPGNKGKPDQFKALLRVRKRTTQSTPDGDPLMQQREQIEQWVFVRQGNWWVLDDRK